MSVDLFMTTEPEPAWTWCISLWQPWASLLFVPGAKVHETRHWPAPARLIGQRVVIHAAKTNAGFRDMEEGDEIVRLCVKTWDADFSLPRGAFIGTAILAASFKILDHWEVGKEPASDEDELCGDWSSGRYAWRMDDRTPLPAPIPAKGQQGFWKIPA